MKHNFPTWAWVLTANFSEGLPYTIINVLLVALLADMGCSNGVAAMIPSLLALPWMWKFVWAPFVDVYSTKQRWMQWMMIILFVTFFAMAALLNTSFWLWAVIGCSMIAAMASATYDVACDGYYMIALDKRNQSAFVGIRNTCYRIAMVFGQGALVVLAGVFERRLGSVPKAWSATMVVSAAILALVAVYHSLMLPVPSEDGSRGGKTASSVFSEFGMAFSSFFGRLFIISSAVFINLYHSKLFHHCS